MRLTKKEIDRANKRRKYSDGRGLFLSVSANGRKTWSFCYRFPDPTRDRTGPDGKLKRGYRERELSLGSIDFMDVDEARDRAVEFRRMVRLGVDPMEERDRETRTVIRQRRDGTTFRQVADRYIDMKKAEWDAGGKSEQSWRGSLSKHVYPVIGDMAVDRIDRADVLDLVRPIWTKVPVTAKRLCRAMTRRGTECRSRSMPNGRCRMHGGKSPGPPKGNKNAWKHGLRSAEHRRLRALVRDLGNSVW